jgi:hypothetical protein
VAAVAVAVAAEHTLAGAVAAAGVSASVAAVGAAASGLAVGAARRFARRLPVAAPQ